MATKQFTGAPERADHDRPTAPLPTPADAAALARLERALSPASSSCPAVTPRGTRTPTGAPIACAGGHTPGDPHGGSFGRAGWHTWTDGTPAAPSPELLALADAYRSHAAHVAELAQLAASGRMSDLDADALVATEDLAAGTLAALAQAGRLDLIVGGA
ncbi:hypothetical protein [Streptomyces ortus]|uniref:Uncharacterized protein n=1 Tax=Streptomyces ortus TaxID=2867268 RepID=A0ABT3UWZ3_9ACTN|nr:hypothetical protein [Streptomyces ortus]MCX4232056.1 hypothetical protein [Streptomyces ortus]